MEETKEENVKNGTKGKKKKKKIAKFAEETKEGEGNENKAEVGEEKQENKAEENENQENEEENDEHTSRMSISEKSDTGSMSSHMDSAEFKLKRASMKLMIHPDLVKVKKRRHYTEHKSGKRAALVINDAKPTNDELEEMKKLYAGIDSLETKNELFFFNINQDINYRLNNEEINDDEKKKYEELREKLNSMKNFNLNDFIKDYEENFRLFKEDIGYLDYLRKWEERINNFMMFLKNYKTIDEKQKLANTGKFRIIDRRAKTKLNPILEEFHKK